ncbi:MAG: protein kinase [Akkermansiaceae bacterium]|nr:protein kinase [Akkermansiaceae bacterium]
MDRPAETRCPECGSPAFLTEPGGFCPGCLLAGALDPVDDAPDEAAPPVSCGGYLLEREIGRGGTGVVFLARLPGIERSFAIKMPATQFAGPDEIRRFRVEIESATKLDHPHIVPAHYAGEEQGRPYLVMKYAAGGSLRTRIETRGSPDADDLREDVALTAKVARAVHFAHERGVLHRDLKPANILLDETGEPMVADFGLARLLHGPSGATITGSAIGTPAYMAPEQAAGGSVTTAADVYSLGAVLYHLLTSRPPFESASPLETLRRVTSEEAPDPRKHAPHLDRDLATICLKCLHRDPLRRYHSASDLADDLDRWLRGEPVLARPAGPAERLAKWSRRHPAVAVLAVSSAVAALAFVTLLGIGAVVLRRERNEALRQKGIALENAGLARESAEAFRQNAYAADIYLASRAIDDGQLGVARTMLARHVPGDGEADPRGFEWFALHDRCRGADVRTFRDHKAAVTCVAFDPTGKLLASAGRDGRLFVHDVETGGEVVSLPRPDAPRGAAEIPLMARLAARSPEMKRLLLTTEVSPDEMRMRGRPSKPGEFSALAWSPDGTLLASASTGAYVRLWSMPAGELVGILPRSPVYQLGFSDDGSLLVSLRKVGNVSDIRIHRIDDLAKMRRIDDVQPCFSLAGGRLAFVRSAGMRMEIQDLASGETLHTWDAGTGISSLAFSPDAETIHAVDPLGRKLFHWRCEDGTPIAAETKIAGNIRALALMPDGPARITAGTGQSILIERPGEAPVRLAGHEDEILALDVSPDGRWIASAGNDRTARLWQVPGGAPPPATTSEDEHHPVDASADGRSWLCSSERDGVVLRTLGEAPRPLPDAGDRRPLGFDETGKHFLTWRAEGREAVIEWWDSATLTRSDTRRLAIGFPGPWVVKSSSGGRLLACAASRKPVAVFDLRDGSQVHRFPVPDAQPLRLEFTPDQRRLLLFAWPRSIQIGGIGGAWGPLIEVTTGTAGPIAFSPDSRLLATGADDNTIAIREVDSGRLIRELRGHRSQLVALAFTPDGRTLASSAADRTLRLWHTATWRALGTIDDEHLHGFLRFDAAGKRLLVVPWRDEAFLIPRETVR